MRYAKLGGMAVLIGMMSVAAAQTPDNKIAARPITYADLGKLVRSQRGKVVVVDFWRFD
jgi:hypothetical protein